MRNQISNKLYLEIASVNIAAAAWIAVVDLQEFRKNVRFPAQATELRSAFQWNATPQGHAYWRELDRLIGDLEDGHLRYNNNGTLSQYYSNSSKKDRKHEEAT